MEVEMEDEGDLHLGVGVGGGVIPVMGDAVNTELQGLLFSRTHVRRNS